MYDQLAAMERESGTVLPDSPTHRVGAPPLKQFESHRHLARLWSMDKAQSEQAVLDWARRAEKLRLQAREAGAELPPLSFVVEHKFDGLTINLTYEGGVLVQAATRGNGEEGEAILPQVRTIRSIPLAIPFQGRMEVHGEAFMPLSVLEEYNKTAPEPLKNARNGAAGALRALDPAVLTVCQVSAGDAYNIIPQEMTITGSVRTFSEQVRREIPVLAERIARGVCAANGADCAFSYEYGYATVVNDEALTRGVEEGLAGWFGPESILHIEPVMPGEDFSALQKDCPACFVEIGTRDAAKGTDKPHHNPAYRMDEEGLRFGAGLLASILAARLGGK